MQNKWQARQGDVFIESADSDIPKDSKRIGLDRGRYILAYGEVTGHAHAIPVVEPEEVELWEDNQGVMWLKVKKEEAKLVHEEHGQITLKRGTYRVRHQVESDFDEERRVAD
jgi:hypothetical protein